MVDKGKLEDSIPELGLHMNDVHAAGNGHAALVHEIPPLKGRSIIMRNSLDLILRGEILVYLM